VRTTLRELEKERKRLLKAGDARGLRALAERATKLEIPAARLRASRDRLVYAAEQNARFAARAKPEPEARGLAIGVAILSVLVVGGFVAVAVFADGRGEPYYSLQNDTGSPRRVRHCDNSECRFPGPAELVRAGESYDNYEPGGDTEIYIVANRPGKTLGCVTVHPSYGLYLGSLSALEPCPPGAPKFSG
jgi:hypothetical protein